MARKRVQTALLFAALLVTGCALFPSETPPPTASATPTPRVLTPTSTKVLPSLTPTGTATPPPTLAPTLAPTRTPVPPGQTWTRYPNSTDVRAVLPADDALWLATAGGLVRIGWNDGRWSFFNETDGLADNSLYSISEQGDMLWIGTEGGASRLDRQTGEWRTFTTQDGLSSNHGVLVHFDGQRVWAGTRNGISWYDPAS